MPRYFPGGAQSPASVNDRNGITTPPRQDFDTPAMEGSMQQFLSENLGTYVVIEFLVGTQTLTRKAGVLYAVGTSVVTLYEEVSQTFVTCDIFSVKFVTFYLPGRRPWQTANPLFGQAPMGQMGQMNPSQSWMEPMGMGQGGMPPSQMGRMDPSQSWMAPMGMAQGGMAMPAPGFAPSVDASAPVTQCEGV